MAVTGSPQNFSNSSCFWKNISLDPASGVVLVHHKLHLCFAPYYLADLRKSVRSVVDSRLIRYESELGGILAGYGRIAILHSKAETLFNLSDIHVDVEGDFYVFKPEIGKELIGVVNRKSSGHIGCLVHGLFNISLHKPASVAFNSWLGKSAKLLDKVRFTITRIDLQSQVPYIEGVVVELIPEPEQEVNSLSRQRSSSDSGVSVASEASILSTPEENMERKRSKLSLSQRKSDAMLLPTQTQNKTPLATVNSEMENQPLEEERRKRKISEESIIRDTPRNKKAKEDNDQKSEDITVSHLVSNLFAVLPTHQKPQTVSTPSSKQKKNIAKSQDIAVETERKIESEMVTVPEEIGTKVLKELKKKKGMDKVEDDVEEAVKSPKKRKVRTLVSDDESDRGSCTTEKILDPELVKPSSPKKSKLSKNSGKQIEMEEVVEERKTPGKKSKKLKKADEAVSAGEVAEKKTPQQVKESTSTQKSKSAKKVGESEEDTVEMKTPKSIEKHTKESTSCKKSRDSKKIGLHTETPNSVKARRRETLTKNSEDVEETDEEDYESLIKQLVQRINSSKPSKSSSKVSTPSSKLVDVKKKTKTPSQEKKMNSPVKNPKASSQEKKTKESSPEKEVNVSAKKQKIPPKVEKEKSPQKILAAPSSPRKTQVSSEYEKILKAVLKEKKETANATKEKTKSKGKVKQEPTEAQVHSELNEDFDTELAIKKILQSVQPKEKSKNKSAELKKKRSKN